MRNEKNANSSRLKKRWLLYIVIATILMIALVGFAIVILPNVLKIERDILFVVSAIYLLASCSFFLWIYLREQDEQFVSELPKVIEEVKRAGREYYKNTAAIENNSDKVEKLHNAIEQEIKNLVKINSSIEKQLMELRQEKGNCERELNNWNKSAIEFFQILERGLKHEKNNERREVMEKNIYEFDLIVQKRGLYRIKPSSNDTYDENEHEFKHDEESSSIEPENILRCERWGYKSGTEVLQRAEVILAKKAEKTNSALPEEIRKI